MIVCSNVRYSGTLCIVERHTANEKTKNKSTNHFAFNFLRFTFFLLVSTFTIFRFASPVHAQGSEGVKIGEEYLPPVTKIEDVGSLVSRVASNLYILAGIVLFVLFIWGGFEWIRGAGSDDREMVGRGKKIIFGGIIGFLIIFASYWIIQLVEALTKFKIF